MKHKIETFEFMKEGEAVKCKSKPYSFELEEVLVERFGREAIRKLNETGKLEADLTLEDAEHDLPMLLENADDIEWKSQDYDEILRVYLFFMNYKRNALLRKVSLDKETLLSDIETWNNVIRSLPDNILTKLNGLNTKSTP